MWTYLHTLRYGNPNTDITISTNAAAKSCYFQSGWWEHIIDDSHQTVVPNIKSLTGHSIRGTSYTIFGRSPCVVSVCIMHSCNHAVYARWINFGDNVNHVSGTECEIVTFRIYNYSIQHWIFQSWLKISVRHEKADSWIIIWNHLDKVLYLNHNHQHCSIHRKSIYAHNCSSLVVWDVPARFKREPRLKTFSLTKREHNMSTEHNFRCTYLTSHWQNWTDT
jgi:hypothetical protein